MTSLTKNKEKTRIELELLCSVSDASRLLSESVESFILPWFMSKTSIKGFIVNNKFLVWPNTLSNIINEIVLTGQITQRGDGTYLLATARVLPLFNLFPNEQSAHLAAWITMFIAWALLAACLALERMYLSSIFGLIFMGSCFYILIQFAKYILKPELVDLEKRFRQIFKGHIKDG